MNTINEKTRTNVMAYPSTETILPLVFNQNINDSLLLTTAWPGFPCRSRYYNCPRKFKGSSSKGMCVRVNFQFFVNLRASRNRATNNFRRVNASNGNPMDNRRNVIDDGITSLQLKENFREIKHICMVNLKMNE